MSRFPLRLLLLPTLALSALRFRGPSDPLRPSTPEDGVGPLTRRRYWIDIEDTVRSPEEVAEHWREHLPDHAPKWLAWFRGLDHPIPPVQRGDRLRIRMLLIRRGRVVIEHVDPLGFRVRTLRLHPDAGTSDFRVYPGEQPGQMILQIESLLRTNSQFDRLAYIFGVHAAQRRNWELTLLSVAKYAAGKIINRGHESLEVAQLTHSFALPKTPVGASSETAEHA